MFTCVSDLFAALRLQFISRRFVHPHEYIAVYLRRMKADHVVSKLVSLRLFHLIKDLVKTYVRFAEVLDNVQLHLLLESLV